MTLPYDDPLHARLHDRRCSIAPVVAGHTEFEIRTVSALAEWHGDRLSRPPRWLDFACGAGFHQGNAGGKMERVGLERPKAMLDADRARKGHEARFTHRENPERCMEMILAMVAKVRPGGRFLPGVNPLPLDVPGQLATAFGPVTTAYLTASFQLLHPHSGFRPRFDDALVGGVCHHGSAALRAGVPLRRTVGLLPRRKLQVPDAERGHGVEGEALAQVTGGVVQRFGMPGPPLRFPSQDLPPVGLDRRYRRPAFRDVALA